LVFLWALQRISFIWTTSGNRSHSKAWTREVSGQVQRVWQGVEYQLDMQGSRTVRV
jgi:hypothetical protein